MSPQVAIISSGVVVDILNANLLLSPPKDVTVIDLPQTHNVGIGDEYVMGCFVAGKHEIDFYHAISLLNSADLQALSEGVFEDAVKQRHYEELCHSGRVSLNDSRLRTLFTSEQLLPLYQWGKIAV